MPAKRTKSDASSSSTSTNTNRRLLSKSKQGESRICAQRLEPLLVQDTVAKTNTRKSTTMPLGKIDFSTVVDLVASPDGEYDGKTISWESKPSNDQQSMNIIAKFSYEDSDGNARQLMNYWNLKPQALWRIKRDLIAMGADPNEFASEDVDLQGILNELFDPTVPTQVVLTLGHRSYKVDTSDPDSEERVVNTLEKVRTA